MPLGNDGDLMIFSQVQRYGETGQATTDNDDIEFHESL